MSFRSREKPKSVTAIGNLYDFRPDLRPLSGIIELFQPGEKCPSCKHYLSGYGVSKCLEGCASAYQCGKYELKESK